MQLDGKVAMISGGSRGLGAALARRFAAEGAAVSVCARSGEELDALAAEIRRAGGRCATRVADVTSEVDVARWTRATVEQLGGVDVLVNNASILGPRAPIEEYAPDAWRSVLEVNLTGAYLCARAAIGPLRERRGSMIHVSSGVGDHGRPRWGAYSVAKNGVEALSEILAGELEPDGVRSNAVDPGRMRTRMRRAAYPDEDPETLPRPIEVTDVFVWLASDASRPTSGGRFRAQEFEPPEDHQS